ncbi:hypothetical protein HOLleu_19463 [Holothuria leucospilota]|uniref:Uncharacterized protein n=1 Tax=Holothuria leucospilota TaxID=206669 RepID=A0A9Q1BZZ3_HOLLE|nr:hypothetical protein HOLleu_19463 [Holothuria leucospilota]
MSSKSKKKDKQNSKSPPKLRAEDVVHHRPVNSENTGTTAVQVTETRKGHISVKVDEGELDQNSNVVPSVQVRKKKVASPKKVRRRDPSESPDSAFYSGDDAEIPPNMRRNEKEIKKTFNYSYSRSGKVKENHTRRTSIHELTERFGDFNVKQGSAMDI